MTDEDQIEVPDQSLTDELAEGWIDKERHKPTETLKNMVMLMIAGGLQVNRIASTLRMAESTFRRYYKHEIENGKTLLDGQVLAALFRNIQAGKERSIIYYLASRMEGFAPGGNALFNGRDSDVEYEEIEQSPETIKQADLLWESVRK